MAKDPKIQYDESDSEDEEPSKEELMELLQETPRLMNKRREEFKELHKRHKALEQTFEEHLAAYWLRLMRGSEKLTHLSFLKGRSLLK